MKDLSYTEEIIEWIRNDPRLNGIWESKWSVSDTKIQVTIRLKYLDMHLRFV